MLRKQHGWELFSLFIHISIIALPGIGIPTLPGAVMLIWSGLGTTLIAITGIFYFKEPSTAIKILSIGLIITGVIGLNLSGGGH